MKVISCSLKRDWLPNGQTYRNSLVQNGPVLQAQVNPMQIAKGDMVRGELTSEN
jgi:hypothetical protein